MNRESFVKKLQDVIRDSGLQQNIIAEALDLSSAAISQFIHGIVLPNPEQLSSILSLLCIPEEEQVKLVQDLYTLREECGEEDSRNDIDYDELDEDFVNATSLESIFTDMLTNDPQVPSQLMFAEPQIGGIPVIHLHDLDDYTPSMGLYDFATMIPHDLLLRDYGSLGTPVVVLATGTQLGLRYCGMIQMTLAEDVPFSLSALALICLPGYKYRMIPAGDRKSCRGLESLFDMKLKIDTPPLWGLPIVEFTLLPGSIDDMRKELPQ
ncbi:MAG: helix-turn-helix transcriptional regulator [Lentisphaerae bacterium]|nr:helix-turn-helix transcriptional regulator [Lentisphaerota bacterium]